MVRPKDGKPNNGPPRVNRLKAEISWQEGVRFESVSGSGHTLITDGPESSGGTNAGARPMELVLIGTGGCASYDVVTILKKMKQQVVHEEDFFINFHLKDSSY